MMRFLLTIQYLGTNYSGWQTQANATGIQQVVEEALGSLCNATIRIEGAGRTDSGVHALGQMAHVDVPIDIEPRGLMLAVNTRLPDDVRVAGAEQVPDNFHARFEAKEKTYLYQIWNGETKDVFLAPTHAHVIPLLDERSMNRAAAALMGTHDFASYTVASPEVSSTIRQVRAISVEEDTRARPQGRVIRVRITADGFLRYMVRRIAGSLIEVGRGSLDESAVVRSLEPTLEPARWTAPPHGLTLLSVRYR